MRDGWQTKTLGELLAVIRNGNNCKQDRSGIGNKVSRIESISGAKFDTDKVGYAKLNDQDKERFRLRQGDILFSHINSAIHVGKTAVFDSDEEVYHGVNLLLMRPSGEVSSSYLERYLKFLFQGGYWRGVCKQSVNQASVNQRDISRARISFPTSRDEQQRIVDLLDEAFTGLATAKAKAERNLHNAIALYDCHLEAVFCRRDEGWVEHALGDLIEIQNGYAFKSNEYTESGYFVIRIGNVQDGEISLNNPRYIRLTDQRIERFVLEEGDILVSLTGNIGRVGIIQGEHLPAVLNQRVARITVKNKSIDRDFLFQFLSSRTFRAGLQSAGHGTAQQNVSTKEIESVRLSMPSRIVQQATVDEFNRFDEGVNRLTNIYERKLAALEELKKSLLQQAFNGEL
jgi:type I restriction enzyme, S subunit